MAVNIVLSQLGSFTGYQADGGLDLDATLHGQPTRDRGDRRNGTKPPVWWCAYSYRRASMGLREAARLAG